MRIEVVPVEAGEVLWTAKSKCDFAIFVCSGNFELEGNEDQIGKIKLTPGQFVGDFPSIMNEKTKTISTVRCIKSGDTLQIKKPLLIDFLSNNPGLFIYIRDKLVVE